MLKRIPVQHLRQGMYIHELCGSWLEHPFWRNAFKLSDPRDIPRITDAGITEVWIDTDKGCDVIADPSEVADRASVDAAVEEALEVAAGIGADSAVKRVDIHSELARAANICSEARIAVTSMFADVRMGKAFQAEAAENLVENIADSVMRNPGALISLARLKRKDDYTYMHSVAVCGLMIALARQLGMPEDAVRSAGLAGLLHDLGKAMISPEVLNKPGKLTDAEFELIKTHPAQGYSLLLEAGGVGEPERDVCLHHHEKVDGTGYPDRLKGDQISVFARMGAVCDVYDAITSNRPYKPGWGPAESIRRMTEWSKGHFDEPIFHAFIRSIGIYPVGALVRLQSGRLGVVIEQSEKSLLAPVVRAFYSTKSDAYVPQEVIDISRPGCTDGILRPEDPSRWHFRNLDELWQTPPASAGS